MASLISDKPIPARTQYAAIAWLRWRLFVNSFHRDYKGGRKTVSLILFILLRVLVWTVMAAVGIGPIVGAGLFAHRAIMEHRPADLAPLLGTAFLVWQFVSINGLSIAATVANFDPTSLIRFPLLFRRYLIIRLMLGWLTPSAIFGCLCMISITIGLGAANYRLILPALLVLSVYAALNILFVRMLGVWIERWLATRRGREIYGILFALSIIGMQYFNMRVNSETARRAPTIFIMMQHASPFFHLLPPGLAANAILLADSHPLAAFLRFAGVIAYGVFFFAIFAMRLKKQFLGEYLSEGTVLGSASKASRTISTRSSETYTAPQNPTRSFLSPAFSACVYKEWIYSHRNARFIALLTPIFLVFILGSGRGVFGLHPDFLLPGAMAYVLFAPLAGLFNIFGEDASGVQLYLMAPVRLRDVILAKNAISAGRILILAILTWIAVLFVSHAPIQASIYTSTAFWIVFALFLNLSLGNLRSIQAPRRSLPGQGRSQTSSNPNQASGWLAVVLSIGSGLLQIPVLLLARRLVLPWLSAIIFGVLSAAVLAGYGILLNNSERLIQNHRDGFAEELYKSQ